MERQSTSNASMVILTSKAPIFLLRYLGVWLMSKIMNVNSEMGSVLLLVGVVFLVVNELVMVSMGMMILKRLTSMARLSVVFS